MSTVVFAVGARPNFVKMAPVIEAVGRTGLFRQLVVHTGQHYDERMSAEILDDLGFPKPDRFLGVGSGSHGEQTGFTLIAFERVLLEERPDLVVVSGDVNATLACSLAASKLGVPVAHVESGLRSRDWSMPEEVNRVVTDRVSRAGGVPLAKNSRGVGSNDSKAAGKPYCAARSRSTRIIS